MHTPEITFLSRWLRALGSLVLLAGLFGVSPSQPAAGLTVPPGALAPFPAASVSLAIPDPTAGAATATAALTLLGWAKAYGGSNYDYARSIAPTSDGGYVVAGSTASFGAGSEDVWVLKLDSTGNILWQKTYGGSNYEWSDSIASTGDGGYVVAGRTASFGVAASDAWVLKLDGTGNVQWQKTYGGSNYDHASSIAPTSDGGYVVAGYVNNDAWALKLDDAGNVLWQKTYGGISGDYALSIAPTGDAGYVMAGSTASFGAGWDDAWVLKLDGTGNIVWQKTYGGTSYDYATSIAPTGDGGYVVAGRTEGFGAGYNDVWVLKLDSVGDVLWQKTYGASNGDLAWSITPTSDGGYVVAGSANSFDGTWVLKLDGAGAVLWQKAYGVGNGDEATSIARTGDGGYVVAGKTYSFGAGGSDMWVLKLDANGNIGGTCPLGSTSSASVASSTAITSSTSITVSVATITVTTSLAAVGNSSAQVGTRCQPSVNYLPVLVK